MGYSRAEGPILVAEGAVEIRVLSRQGKSIREIAQMLEVSRNTVRPYLRGKALPQYQREARPSKLDPYRQYIDESVKSAAPDWISATALLGGLTGGVFRAAVVGEQRGDRLVLHIRYRPGGLIVEPDRRLFADSPPEAKIASIRRQHS